ncbi:hypothetical protein PCANB_001839 [Pneumocystis canis]|nr:hypothetical protein PCANB_001839 [Pneumocystis canis]
MLQKKKNIITELIVTEENYRDDLFIIEKIYKKKAIEYSVLSLQDMEIIFCNIYDIWQFTNKFSKLLRIAGKNILDINFESENYPNCSETLYSKLSDTWIGKAFNQMIPQIEKIYSIYCINHSKSSKKLQKLKQNTNVQKWLQECKEISKKQTNAWDLESLLIKPVQRILKYPLLLIQILDTSPNHPDIIFLNHANKKIILIIDKINETKRCKDTIEQMISGKSNNDIRHVITKGISRKTEKLKQTIGIIETYHDIFYETLFEEFQRQQIQILVFKKRIRNWMQELTNCLLQQNNFASSFNYCITCEKTLFNQTQAKFSYCQQQWYKFWISKLINCLPDHYDPSINFNDLSENFMKKNTTIQTRYSKFNIIKTSSRISCYPFSSSIISEKIY